MTKRIHRSKGSRRFLLVVMAAACGPGLRDDGGDHHDAATSVAQVTDAASDQESTDATASEGDTSEGTDGQDHCTWEPTMGQQCNNSVNCARIRALSTSGVSDDGAPCISDLYGPIGCAVLPCEPYDGYICHDEHGGVPYYVGEMIPFGDGVSCIPEGWHPCYTDAEPTFCLGD